MSAFTILNVEHGGRPIPAAPELYDCTWPEAQSIKTSAPSRPPKASLAVDIECCGVRHDVATVTSSSAQRMRKGEFFSISSLPNDKVVAPPPLNGECEVVETRNGGCPPTPCSFSSLSGAATSIVDSMEVEGDGSGQPLSDLGQLAGTQLAHGYESPQVGLPHQAVRELLGASQSHPSDQRIVPPTPHLGSGS